MVKGRKYSSTKLYFILFWLRNGQLATGTGFIVSNSSSSLKKIELLVGGYRIDKKYRVVCLMFLHQQRIKQMGAKDEFYTELDNLFPKTRMKIMLWH